MLTKNEETQINNFQYKTEKNQFIFKSTQYHVEFTNNLYQLKNLQKFCDVILKTNDNKSLKAHKIILSCGSEYFRTLFTTEYFMEANESSNNEFLVIDANLESLNQIIDFLYTGKIVINEINVNNLLATSRFLQIENIVEACCIYLENNLNPNNCLSIEHLAEVYGCTKLHNLASKYMMDHCSEVLKSEEFLKLEQERLISLLESDNLNIRHESVILKAVFDWIKYDLSVRRFKIDKVFACVRVFLLSPKCIRDEIENNEIFKLDDASNSKKLMQKVYYDLTSHVPTLNTEFFFDSNPRKPSCTLYVIGGYSRHSINLSECLNLKTLHWKNFSFMPTARSGF